MRIAYFYLMKNDRDRVRAVAPDHAAYWRELRMPGYLGGPLADRSGGLITFEAHSEEAAHQLIANDPFVRADLLESAWINEWNLEASEPVVGGFRPVRKEPSGQSQEALARPVFVPGR